MTCGGFVQPNARMTSARCLVVGLVWRSTGIPSTIGLNRTGNPPFQHTIVVGHYIIKTVFEIVFVKLCQVTADYIFPRVVGDTGELLDRSNAPQLRTNC